MFFVVVVYLRVHVASLASAAKVRFVVDQLDVPRASRLVFQKHDALVSLPESLGNNKSHL